MRLSYVLPIRAPEPAVDELPAYLHDLLTVVDEVIVVDGSPPEVFAAHGEAWPGAIRHVRPETERWPGFAGKAQGVHTGVELATNEHVVIADDDVRWTPEQLEHVDRLLADGFHLVRPQNVFAPAPWHARWDTGRTLIARAVSGGDHGGTLAFRRSAFLAVGGYDGRVLFENLELERTIAAAPGARVHVALDLLVVRRPPTTRHFLGQRVRQAYDEIARPRRMAVELSLLPAAAAAALRFRAGGFAATAAAAVAVAEVGRRRRGGRRTFGATTSLWAPLWVSERAVTTWLALGCRLFRGGVRWGDARLTLAATPVRVLERRLASVRLVLDAEADLHRDLEVLDVAVDDVTPDLGGLEPVEVTERP